MMHHPRTTSFARSFRRGFTMMEMMVAIGITSVMMLLVNQVFNSATTAVKRGADVSTIVSNGSTFSSQMFQDVKEMITTHANPVTDPERLEEPGAFLVIVQQTNTGVKFPVPRKENQPPSGWPAYEDTNGNGTQDPGERDFIHSSQIIFFREANHMDAVAPGATDRYDSETRAPIARVWYGHIARPDSDHTPNGAEVGDAAGNSVAANELVIGRQALLILDEQGTWPDGAGGGIYAVGGDVNAGAFNLNTQVYNLSINGGLSANYDVLWEGATDAMSIDDLADTTTFTFDKMFRDELSKTNPIPGLYGVTATTHPTAAFHRLRTGFVEALNNYWMPVNPAYLTAATNWGYITPGTRLNATQEVSYPYSPEQVGRTHAYFIPYATDFAIDFAADITDDYDAEGDYRFDVSGSTPSATVSSNAAFAADGLPDGRPDEYAYIDDNGDLIKAIKWYNVVDGNQVTAYDQGTNPNGAGAPIVPSKPVTWYIPQNVVSSNPAQQWDGPYHSTTALSPSNPDIVNPTAGDRPYPPYVSHATSVASTIKERAIFVFGHTPDLDLYTGGTAQPGPDFGDGSDADGFESGCAKWWPYMIRIRYRLHDDDASFSSIDEVSNQPVSGKWFEQILPVPRK